MPSEWPTAIVKQLAFTTSQGPNIGILSFCDLVFDTWTLKLNKSWTSVSALEFNSHSICSVEGRGKSVMRPDMTGQRNVGCSANEPRLGTVSITPTTMKWNIQLHLPTTWVPLTDLRAMY